LAISQQSYWIDEALTALKAARPSLGGWWQHIVAEQASDLQMPVYMLYAWGWAKLFGTGEWVLRTANLPWFVGGVAAFALSFRGLHRLFAAAVVVLSSFAWFYLDEARPYAMQLGLSLFLVAAIRFLNATSGDVGKENRWVWTFCAGLWLLAGTSLLGVFWCGAAVVALVVVLGRARVLDLWRSVRGAWLVLGVGLCGLAVYYLWTLSAGARASTAGTTNLQNAVFIGYELLGFGGLGPGRLEIREAGLTAFRAHVLPLAVYGGFVVVVLVAGAARLGRCAARKLAVVGTVMAVTLGCLLLAGWALHFRVLGRHCAPAFVAVMVVLVAGATELISRRGWWQRLVVAGFLALSLGSCLSARFAARHQKDDYRAAADRARVALAAGQNVWWSADRSGAEFYGVPLRDTATGRADRAWWVVNASADSLLDIPLPDVVVCSKPDLYDGTGTLAGILTREHFGEEVRFAAFTIWTRKK
jgi:hypothetical protein